MDHLRRDLPARCRLRVEDDAEVVGGDVPPLPPPRAEEGEGVSWQGIAFGIAASIGVAFLFDWIEKKLRRGRIIE